MSPLHPWFVNVTRTVIVYLSLTLHKALRGNVSTLNILPCVRILLPSRSYNSSLLRRKPSRTAQFEAADTRVCGKYSQLGVEALLSCRVASEVLLRG